MRTPQLVMGFCLSALTAPVFGQDAVPDTFEISKVTANGDGCPSGSVEPNIAEDKLSFYLRFSSYLAEIGPNIAPSSNRKACQITINLKVPTGWKFSIANFDYTGYLDLDEGISADHVTTYYFQGNDKTGEFTSTKPGPDDKPFHFAQEVKLSDKVWSPCEKDRALNIKTAIRVLNTNKAKFPNAAGIIGTDSVLGSFQYWRVSWSKCP